MTVLTQDLGGYQVLQSHSLRSIMESIQSNIPISTSIFIQKQDTWEEILVFCLSYSPCLLTVSSGPSRVKCLDGEEKKRHRKFLFDGYKVWLHAIRIDRYLRLTHSLTGTLGFFRGAPPQRCIIVLHLSHLTKSVVCWKSTQYSPSLSSG